MDANSKKTLDFNLKLEGFDGPLAFLLHLVQQKEVDIFDIRLKQIIEIFLEDFKTLSLDISSEFIGTFSQLIFYKSKGLLPEEEKPECQQEDSLDEKFDIIHKLIDYCVFKEAGKKLVFLEEAQQGFFLRGLDSKEPLPPKSLGIQHLTLDDLAAVFTNLMEAKQKNCKTLYEEEWRVADKICFLKEALIRDYEIPLSALFLPNGSKLEWIVTFLAILELMKNGKLLVFKKAETFEICIGRAPVSQKEPIS